MKWRSSLNDGQEHSEDYSRDRRLWQAVIYRLIADATRPLGFVYPVKKHGENQERFEKRRRTYLRERKIRRQDKMDAQEWLTEDHEDFRMVCDFAGFDPDWIRRLALDLQERDWPKVEFYFEHEVLDV